MAAILLGAVVGKLAEFTVDKVLQLCEVNEIIENLQSLEDIVKEVKNLKKELSSIQALIEDADNRRIVDKTKKEWLMDLIEIAYQIEDALDIFLLECPTALEDSIQSLPKKKLRLSCLCMFSEEMINIPKKILKLPFLSDFQKKMANIRKDISRIHERGMNYNANNLGEIIMNTQSSLESKLDPIGDPVVVGFDEDIKNIVQNLCDENYKSLAVVSIVGPGGLGKTTLARKVLYSDDVRSKFGEPAWVTISQNYNLLEILKKIAKSFNVVSTDLDANELANKIAEHLKERKYLIVLDDVWTKELWDELKKVLPDTNKGSRVLITTRLEVDVARYADTTYDPYQPNLLDYKQSLELFLKNAIPKSHQHPEVEGSDLKDLPDKFIKKCKGLPLALVVLGRLLSTKPYKYSEWKELLETMNWQDDGEDCIKVIATSFEHLPFARKFCFMYFAAFPEDREIKAPALLSMWIAEGLIPPKKQRTLEATAERFLEDLVQRSMVQVSVRYSDGSIKFLRVHDILRDLAIQKAKENKFLVVCSKEADWELPHCREARRVAVHYSHFNESMKQYASPNLRSLLIFGDSELDCSKFRLLRVLADRFTKVELQSFPRLSHLRYLELHPLKDLDKEDLEKWIKTMKSLQLLLLEIRAHGDLINWEIETLRHVVVEGSIEGPPASANLPNLQTLNKAKFSPSWDTSKLPNIPEMRELSLKLTSDDQSGVIAALLGKLNHLVYLYLSGRDIQIQEFEGMFPTCENLKYMGFGNKKNRRSTVELKDNMLPPNLIELSLSGFEFKSDPMPVLEKLGSLKILEIYDSNILDPPKISCSAGGFKQLEHLCLRGIEELQELTIELGALPLLEKLDLYQIQNLQKNTIELGALPLLKSLKVVCCELPVPQLQWFMDHKSLRDFEWLSTKNDAPNALMEIRNARPDIIIRC